MKKILSATLVAISMTFSGCYLDVIDSGEVGVEVVNGKVSENVLGTGFQFSLNPLTSLEIYNTKSKTIEMVEEVSSSNTEKISTSPVLVLTKDNLQIPVDVTVLYKLNGSCAPKLRINYGLDGVWEHKIIVPKTKDIARAVIGKDADVYKLNQNRDIYASEIKQELVKQLNEIVGQDNCFSFESVAINNIRIPQELSESILRKQQTEEAVKIAQLEVEKIKAQAQAEIEKNKGVAEAQMILTRSLTPQLLQWKQLEIKQMEIEKWNGVMPTTMMNDSKNGGFLLQR